MSEFHVNVVRLGAVEKHPNADTLSITQVHGGYPCIEGADHVREGIVVKPIRERTDPRIGRVFAKMAGQGYLLRKGA